MAVRILLVVTVVAGMIAESEARTWFVEKDGTGDYAIIQDALDAAASGDTIRIGPGRFEDFYPYTYPGGDYLIIANVEVGSLTIIGSGSGSTILGPTTYPEPYPDPHTIGVDYIRQDEDELLRIENVAFENLRTCVYVENSGRLSISSCTFEGGDRAICTYSSGVVSSCEFRDIVRGVISFSPADSVVVEGSSFLNTREKGVLFQATGTGVVANCTFRAGDSRGGGVLFDRSGGAVYGCTIEGMDHAIYMLYPYMPEITDNEIRSYWHCINSNSEAFIAEGNLFSSEAGPVIRFFPNGLPHYIRNNHILRGTNYAVEIPGCLSAEPAVIDMSGNWWGTTERDSIAAWIYDGNDQQFPPLECYVDFEPFLDAPVPSKKKSFGGLKAMYR